MFGFGKKKAKGPVKGDRDALKAQAMDNVRKARAEIGTENLDRLAAMLQQKGMGGPPQMQNKTEKERAEETIRGLDKSRLADNLKAMMDD